MPKPTTTTTPTPDATPDPIPNPIPFPCDDEVYAAVDRLLTPAKDRKGATAAERKGFDRWARATLAYAFVAVDSRQPAPWAGFAVTMDNGSVQPLSRLVRILAVGEPRDLGRPVSCRIG